MDNPFAGLKKRTLAGHAPTGSVSEQVMTNTERREKRDSFYEVYTPMVSEVLDQLIDSYAPDAWKQGSDISHLYCCHINWFAGPLETYHANYDEHHEIRRYVEITLEQDSLCNPTGFKIINHENIHKVAHVGLTREELIHGIAEVFD